MNIQNSPKQIALTNDQITGIKNKYAAMVPAKPLIDNSSVAASAAPLVDNSTVAPVGLPQAEIQFASPAPETAPQTEPNIFDTTPSSPVVEPVQPATAPTPEMTSENIFDIPAAPIQSSPDSFASTNNNPTNAEIIGSDQNIFNTVDSNVTPVVESTTTVENSNGTVDNPVNNDNIFVENQVNPTPVNNTVTFEELLKDYIKIQNEAVTLYAMIESFGTKME